MNPNSLEFGNVVVGKSQTQSVTLTNGGGSAVSVTQASASSASFTIQGLTLPLSLNPGQSATFSVLFSPKTAGSVSGSIALAGSASTTTAQTANNESLNVSASLSMSGSGIASGQLNAAPSPLYGPTKTIQVVDAETGEPASRTLRSTCCLIYKVPTGRMCGACPLAPKRATVTDLRASAPERRAALQAGD